LLVKTDNKIEEAKYFLTLLTGIEKSGQPLTKRNVHDEATYLTSALMNACYSVLEHLRNGIAMEVERIYGKASKSRIRKELGHSVGKFKKKHPEIGKQRGISVHRNPVPVERHRSGGGWGSSMWGENAWGSGGRVQLRFSDPPQEPVVATFGMDIRQLEEFIRDACEDYLPSK